MSAEQKRVRPAVFSFDENVVKLAKKNIKFRKVIYRGKFSELAAMSIWSGAHLGEEIHPDNDEIFFVVQGKGQVNIDGRAEEAKRHDAIFIPAGHRHDVRNIGHRDLKLLCVSSPLSSGIHKKIYGRGTEEMKERLRYAWEQ
jgi:mannose-6-phosphate isomerase-like protein (cupin superfamily)